MNVIEVENLTRTFGALTAVNNLNLTVAQGEVFGLVGPDGAGKTTTLRMLCGLMNITSGSARIAGFDVSSDAQQVKDRIGYMAQKFGLYGDLTVEENLYFYADLFAVSGSERDELMGQQLRMTRMEPFRSRPAAKLSGGMKQKLALMCTLLHRPQILFLDEPTNGVDPVSRRDFWVILYDLVKEGLTVFVTTAYLDEAERCHRVGLMDKGRLILADTPSALKKSLPEACYELVTEDARTARETLRGLDAVDEVVLAGSRLHVFLKPGAGSDSIVRALPDAEVRTVLPSLEDVFIATVRREGRRDAA
ncbi:MAG: ABC transporter ATP-binding protein [Bryobacterales bacterium]|nr:ABC transporter ATP-binding protein [Bryobacterales bacterium]